MNDFPKYAVIVPVFQGEASLKLLFEGLKAFFESRKEGFEVIFVHDGGAEHSWKMIRTLKNEFPQRVRGIRLSRNFGQHNATLCGIAQAKAGFILTMDEDMQHIPEEIEKLIQKQSEKDYDLVYGQYEKPQHGFFRNLSSKILKNLLHWALPDLPSEYSSFRLIKKETAQSILDFSHPNPFLDVYLSWVTTHNSGVTVRHFPRKEGKSAYNLRKLVRHTLQILFNFSSLPLQAFSYLSFVLFLLSTTYAIYVFLRKIIYDDLNTGFATIAIFLGMGFGLVFLGIGFLGEYLQNIHLKNTHKPTYLIKETV